MNYIKQHRLGYGSRRRRHYGNGVSVQDTKSSQTWSAAADQMIGQHKVLDNHTIGILSHRLNKPPSEIRARHAFLLQQELRERKEAAIRISDRLNKLRQQRS